MSHFTLTYASHAVQEK